MYNNIHDNLVGITKKDIYIIKNTINNKVYIGQSIDVKKRFNQHFQKCHKKDNSLLYKAMRKYGKDKFYFEILENNIKNYNDQEQYWIKYYNSITPNGYNILVGGNEPPHKYGIEANNATIKKISVLNNIKKDLKYTNISLSQLAIKYNTNKKTILRINQGISYSLLKEEYPIRKNPNINGKLTEQNIDEIIEILEFTYRQYGDISREYGVGIKTIQEINNGITHKRNNINYPIRKYKNSGQPSFTYEQVTEIHILLKTTNISIRKIAELYECAHSLIVNINSGKSKRYKRKEYIYPIRKK